MGEYFDKVKAQYDPDVVELSALERVKSYTRRVNGKEVHVSEHGRRGDGPSHRADFRSMFGTKPSKQEKKDARSKYDIAVGHAQEKASDDDVEEIMSSLGRLSEASDDRLEEVRKKLASMNLSGPAQGDLQDVLAELKKRKKGN